MGACVWRWYLWGATCRLDSCCWTPLLELCMHYICQQALPCLDYEFQIVPFKWGYKIIFAPGGALSNPLYADKHRVQIVSNPLFWDKVQPNFGSSNPLYLDKKFWGPSLCDQTRLFVSTNFQLEVMLSHSQPLLTSLGVHIESIFLSYWCTSTSPSCQLSHAN